MAVLGALAAVPQVRDFVVPGASGVTAGHGSAASLTDPGQVAGAVADGRPATLNVRRYLPRPVLTSGASGTPDHARHAKARPAASPAPSPAPSPASTPAASSSPATGAGRTGLPKCTAGASGPLPQNYAAIVDFLVAHGYTGFAAAGIAGNIYQESMGNPESVGSGGGGLIGWTPLPAGFVTGNPAADLQTQLQALLVYNQGWAQFIPALNAATSATQAADVYMNDFERPGLPVATNREAAAQAVAAACGI
jgi:Phage tail lysozyme